MRLGKIDRQIRTAGVETSDLENLVREAEAIVGQMMSWPESARQHVNALAGLLTVATGWQRLGDFGRATQALDRGLGLIDASAPRRSVASARFLHDASIFLAEFGAFRPAHAVALAAREALVEVGLVDGLQEFDATIDFLHARIDTDEPQLGPDGASSHIDRVEKARRLLARAPESRRGSASQRLAVALSDDESSFADSYVEIGELLRTSFYSVESSDVVERARHKLASLTTLLEFPLHALPLPDWVATAVRDFRAQGEGSYGLNGEAIALTLLAITQMQTGDEAAEQTLLRAVRCEDLAAADVTVSVVRSWTSQTTSVARRFALVFALDRGVPELAAELIETARLQSVSYQAAPAAFASERFNQTALSAPACVAVGGVSRLASALVPRGGSASEPQVNSLDAWIDRVGGVGAAWWGVWATNQQDLFWACRIRGVYTAGRDSFAVGTATRQVFDSYHLPFIEFHDNTDSPSLLASDWCDSASLEELAACELGEVLLPRALKAALGAAFDSGEVLPLVTSGSFFSMVPTAALGFYLDGMRTARVVEAACVTNGVPAAFAPVVGAPTSHHTDRGWPVGVACVDPRGDLTNSRTPPPQSQRVLGSAVSGHEIATGAALLARLADGDTHSTFYFSGHSANLGNESGDTEHGLALARAEVLTANDIVLWSGAPGGHSMPERVLLSACGSAASTGTGAGEWLGLAAAMLTAGARQIVATSWPIWDYPFTAEFDLELAAALTSGGHAAECLRQTQLSALRRWRRDYAQLGSARLPSRTGIAPFPATWGAYCVVGVAR